MKETTNKTTAKKTTTKTATKKSTTKPTKDATKKSSKETVEKVEKTTAKKVAKKTNEKVVENKSVAAKKTTKTTNKNTAKTTTKTTKTTAKKTTKTTKKTTKKTTTKAATTEKKRLIVSYKNLPEKDMEFFNTTYSEGFMNYLQKIEKPDGTPMFLVPLETEEVMYMVKVEVRVDEHLSDEDFDKEVMDEKEETTLDDLENGKDTQAFKLVHGDYSSEDRLIEQQANIDMNEEANMSIEDVDIIDPDSLV